MAFLVENIANILPAISILVAIVFGTLGWSSSRTARLRAHTIDLIGNLSLNTDLAAADATVAKLVRENTIVGYKEVSDELNNSLMRILDYYEFLSAAYKEGAMEKDTFRHLRGSTMILLHGTVAQYIKERRELYGQSLYKNFESVVEELSGKEP
jgi:hypothetical protein